MMAISCWRYSSEIMSNSILEQVLLEANLVANLDDKNALQPKIRELLSAMKIEQAGRNRIKIAFRDQDANKAYLVTSAITNVFIRDSARSKREESSEAYAFINNQVKAYKRAIAVGRGQSSKSFANRRILAAAKMRISNRLSAQQTSIESLTL